MLRDSLSARLSSFGVRRDFFFLEFVAWVLRFYSSLAAGWGSSNVFEVSKMLLDLQGLILEKRALIWTNVD